MQTKRVFSHLVQKTHMPFYNDGTLIFCMNEQVVKRPVPFKRHLSSKSEREYRPWKLAYADWTSKSISPIATGMSENAVLCNPTFYRHEENLHVSFIAGISHEDGFDYHLYEMFGSSWRQLGSPQQVGEEFAKTGFVSFRFYCLGNANQLTILDRQNHDRFLLTTSLREMSRAIYDPEHPQRLLITGINAGGEYLTLLYDTETQDVQEIRGPAPSYKACLIGNRIVFSYKESEDVEDYQIHIAPATFEPTAETVQTVKI
jgi:hypothetical protein